MCKILIASLFLSSFTFAVQIEKNKIMGAKLYDLKETSRLLYTMKRTDEVVGTTHTITTSYTNPEGQVDAVEKSIVDGAQFKKYVLDQKQLKFYGEVELKGSEVHFTLTKNGKTTTEVEKLKDNFVVSPTIVSYLQKHWDKVLAGEAIDVRFGVADRQETVGFEFKKIGEEEFQGKKVVSIRMKPSSFIIAAIVNPLRFYFDMDGSHLLKIEGRVPPKRKVGESFKDLDALSIYEY